MSGVQERYLKALRDRVCCHCSHVLPDGMCGLADRVCPIERNLEHIAQTVHLLHGEPTHAYLRELRREICSGCQGAGPAGSCRFRETWDCPIDRHLVRAVEAIEDVQQEIRAEAFSTAG